MSESAGRANHQHGAFSFLATQWRALIGAGPLAEASINSTTGVVRR